MIRFVFYTNNISPHQLPLAREVMRRVGKENFLYVGEEIAWNGITIDAGEVQTCVADSPRAQEWLENAEVLYTGGLRPIDLMERRAARGLKTLYASERWFKPLVIGGGKRWTVELPGSLRMLVPWYRRMAKRFVKLANENECVKFLPIGPWSRHDFLRLGVRSDKLLPWGYFVSTSIQSSDLSTHHCPPPPLLSSLPDRPFKILWVGRMISWKRVDTIVRAFGEVSKLQSSKVSKLQLTIVGDGPTKVKLLDVGGRCSDGIEFLPRQSLEKVRALMRQHDLYVLASDANEGWGAVVSEALEEGMKVIGTFEAGASAAILPRERLFHAGDWKALAELIRKEMRGELPPCSIGDWTAEKAAERICE